MTMGFHFIGKNCDRYTRMWLRFWLAFGSLLIKKNANKITPKMPLKQYYSDEVLFFFLILLTLRLLDIYTTPTYAIN